MFVKLGAMNRNDWLHKVDLNILFSQQKKVHLNSPHHLFPCYKEEEIIKFKNLKGDDGVEVD
jgi:hypothetical protein